MMEKKLLSKISLIFPIAYTSIFGMALHFQWMQSAMFIMAVLVLIYIGSLLYDAKTRIKNKMNYEQVWKGCFINAFLAGASIPVPYLIFEIGDGGPHNYSIGEIIYQLFGCAVLGGLSGLVSIVMINQTYGMLGGEKVNNNKDMA